MDLALLAYSFLGKHPFFSAVGSMYKVFHQNTATLETFVTSVVGMTGQLL